MRARTLVYFDGHCLSDLCHITNLARPRPARVNKSLTVPGKDGVTLTGSRLNSITISMQLNFLQPDPEDRRAAMEEVEGWLYVSEPRRLEFTDQDGQYYLAIPSTTGNTKRWRTASGLQKVAFLCPDPVRWGETRSVTSESGTPLDIVVGGTYPTALTVSSTAAVRASSSGLWGASVPGYGYLRTDKLADGSAHAVSFDSASRVHRVDGAAKLPTLDSDWLDSVEPGTHRVVRVPGSGPLTVEWTERWL